MLHLSSLHYCACYYALLCLLLHQQQALAVTIIIDGATTNEWATQEEYQGLLESARDGGAGGDPAVNPNVAGSQALTAAEERQRAEQIVRSLANSNGDLSGSSSSNALAPINKVKYSPVAARLVVGAPVENDDPSATQDVLGSSDAASMGELNAALDRLELIERERKEQLRELNRLKTLETAAEGSVMSALAHHNAAIAVGSAKTPAIRYTGARTISDLVPLTDGDLVEPGKQHLVERETRKKYCGDVLIDLLDMVCKSRFYAGDSEPQVVPPTITKRSVDYAEALAAEVSGASAGGNSRRRKLRTLGQGGAEINTSLSGNHENRGFNDGTTRNNNNLSNTEQHSSSAKNRRPSWAARYRRVRGATNQCCTNPCLVEELKPYCEGPRKV